MAVHLMTPPHPKCETCGMEDVSRCPMPSECGCDHPEVEAEIADFGAYILDRLDSLPEESSK